MDLRQSMMNPDTSPPAAGPSSARSPFFPIMYLPTLDILCFKFELQHNGHLICLQFARYKREVNTYTEQSEKPRNYKSYSRGAARGKHS